MLDYDNIIHEIISEWRSTSTQRFSFQKIALERHVIPIIYHHVRKKILNEKLLSQEKNFELKFNQLSKGVSHVIWIIMWTIKWLLFFRFSRGKIIVTAVGSDRKLSFAYLSNLLKYSTENYYTLVSLNVLCNKDFLFRKKIYYFPRFLYQFRFKTEINKFSNEWDRVLEQLKNLIQEKIRLEVNLDVVKRFINDYSRDYFCANHFLNKFKESICLLIQDFDYTSNKNIYCELFKINYVPTVSLNHSILVYKHIYETIYSDYALVWGGHQKQRIEKLSTYKPKKISLIGNPINISQKSNVSGNKKIWIYYLPSFENPAAETIYRSVDHTLQFADNIKNKIETDKLDIQLLINFHPNDSIKALKKAGFEYKPFTFSEIFEKIELIFCEDSTITIEMLKTEIPIIYLADKNGNDPFNFNNWNTAEIILTANDLDVGINKALIGKIDISRREEHFKYFLGDANKFYENLRNELNEIISS